MCRQGLARFDAALVVVLAAPVSMCRQGLARFDGALAVVAVVLDSHRPKSVVPARTLVVRPPQPWAMMPTAGMACRTGLRGEP